MAEPQAGTPPAEPVVSESAGSAGKAKDGSETADIKASPELVKTWKENVEKANRALAEKEIETRTLREQLLAQQQRAALPPTADPALERDRVLYEQAQLGNPLAIEALTARMDRNMVDQVMNSVPQEHWARVKDIIRASNYNTSVTDALNIVRGSESTTLAEQLRESQKEIERLRNEVKGASTRVPGTSATVVPADSFSGTTDEPMPHSQYLAILARGGDAAAAIKAKKDAGTLKLDWTS